MTFEDPMSEVGQKRKSLRADDFRCSLNNGHRSNGSACPFGGQNRKSGSVTWSLTTCPSLKPGTMRLSCRCLSCRPWPYRVSLLSRGRALNELFDCLEHGLLSTRKEPMIIAVELNELSASDLAGHIAACRNTHGPVVPAVQHRSVGTETRGSRFFTLVSRNALSTAQMPPGLEAARSSPAHQESLGDHEKGSAQRFDPGMATPFGDELLSPGVILACVQRVRIVRGPTALGQ